jgi:hypothetical protein
MPIHEELDASLLQPAQAPHRAGPGVAPNVSRSIADPGSASPDAVLELQRLAGNSVVSGLLGGTAQRSADPAAEEQDGEPSPVLDVVGRGGGTPLEVGVRRDMENKLGADFSNVRLHTDSAATESARAVNANAYTVGEDVVIRNDRWSPDSSEGRQTIAHELTHVVQQRSGPVAGRDTGGGIRLSDPSDEFEQAAEHTAKAIVAGGTAAPAAQAGASGAQLETEDEQAIQGEFVQREGAAPGTDDEELEEEEMPAQGEFVQREAPDEEELEEDETAAQGEFVQREGETEEELEEEKV